MRYWLATLATAAALVGCGARAITVESAPTAAVTVTLSVTNSLSQAVNVYVVTGGSDQLLNQVAANSTAELPVPGVSEGSVVALKARTADGTRTYTKEGVTLGAKNTWKVP